MTPYYECAHGVLYHGDAYEVLETLDVTADALITDPPYGCTACDWDQPPDLPRFWAAARRVTGELTVCAVFAQQPFTTDLIASNRRAYRYEIVWDKGRCSGFLDANRRPLRGHETVQIFSRRFRGATYNPQFSTGHRPYRCARVARGAGASNTYDGYGPAATESDGRRHPTSVLQIPRGYLPRGHGTPKPVALMRWLVETYSHPGGLVLDPFLGTGTTAIAAALSGRRFVGVEREERFCELAASRLETALAEQAEAA